MAHIYVEIFRHTFLHFSTRHSSANTSNFFFRQFTLAVPFCFAGYLIAGFKRNIPDRLDARILATVATVGIVIVIAGIIFQNYMAIIVGVLPITALGRTGNLDFNLNANGIFMGGTILVATIILLLIRTLST